jgi:nicotinamidase-related amidase
MPLTHLDTAAALIVIDLQKGVVSAPVPTAHPIGEIVDRTAQLARAFRDRGLPVVLVNVTGRPSGRTDAGTPQFSLPPDWTELVPELEQQPGDHTVSKGCVGAFANTPLQEVLHQSGVTQIFLAGVATSVGVEATGRHAYDLGYNVVFITDAITDRNADSHQYSMEKIFPRLGELDVTANVLNALQKT